MKKSILTVIVLISSLVLNIIQAQTLDDILAKHFKAVGQDKLVAAQTIIVQAKVKQMGMEMPLEMKIKKPDKFLVTVDMQGQKMIQAFDGEKGWMVAPWISTDPQVLEGDQLIQAQQQADLEGELYNYKKKGSTAELIGKVNIDGKDAYRIKLSTKDGNSKDYFINADTYFVDKVKASVENQGQTMEVEQTMSDFKSFNGITMPTKINSKMPMGDAEIVFEDVKFNEDIDNSVFKQPSK